MQIIYLDHSGFAVEDGKTLLSFDYSNDSPAGGGLAAGVLDAQTLSGYENSLLFFSHSHDDHFVPSAFSLPASGFVISSEFPKTYPGTRLAPLDEAKLGDVAVRAFGSTDLGVSFLVDAFGKRIFHAGDFNYWHWKDESTKEEIDEARALYEGVMQTLLPYAGTIDLCFFPVDPRMGEDTMQGVLDFVARMNPGLTIPMHMQGDTALAQRFLDEMQRLHRPAAALTVRGARLTI